MRARLNLNTVDDAGNFFVAKVVSARYKKYDTFACITTANKLKRMQKYYLVEFHCLLASLVMENASEIIFVKIKL